MITGPIHSQCTALAERVLSMLQWNDSRALLAVVARKQGKYLADTARCIVLQIRMFSAISAIGFHKVLVPL
jgi:hypothetical protein